LEYGTVILPFMNEDISNINVGGLNVNYIDGKVSYGLSIKNVGTEYNSDFSEDAEIKEKMQEESRILYVALTRTIRKLVWFKDLDSDVEDCWANYMEVSE
jgi:DNA helicase-2/ATP-dependent DNA helicase PcrA